MTNPATAWSQFGMSSPAACHVGSIVMAPPDRSATCSANSRICAPAGRPSSSSVPTRRVNRVGRRRRSRGRRCAVGRARCRHPGENRQEGDRRQPSVGMSLCIMSATLNGGVCNRSTRAGAVDGLQTAPFKVCGTGPQRSPHVGRSSRCGTRCSVRSRSSATACRCRSAGRSSDVCSGAVARRSRPPVSIDRLVEALWADRVGSRRCGPIGDDVRLAPARRLGRRGDRHAGSRVPARSTARTRDVDEFEARSSRPPSGRCPIAPSSAYDSALALWRGEPFGEFADEWWALAESTRLTELRIAAREQRAAALIAIGHHRGRSPTSRALVVEAAAPRAAGCPADAGAARHRSSGRRAAPGPRVSVVRLADETGLEPSADARCARAGGRRQVPIRRRRGASLAGRFARLRHPRGRSARERSGGSTRRRSRAPSGASRSRRSDPTSPTSSDFVRRFEAEAQLVARLEHPHIVPLYDYWREPGGAYLVFRLLTGGIGPRLGGHRRRRGRWRG